MEITEKRKSHLSKKKKKKTEKRSLESVSKSVGATNCWFLWQYK